MKIEFLGAVNYTKLKTQLKELLGDKIEESEYDEIVNLVDKLETERKTNIVSSAGRLSRYPGTVFEVLEKVELRDFEKNVKTAKSIIEMGHASITDHDYCVFAIQDVSPVIEQIIIAERFSSFTIKSRREVDFSNVGYYTPDFHDKDGNILPNNDEIKREYQAYEESLFKAYTGFVEAGIKKEDARFVLPYSYNSNIYMGIDAHTLKDMIIKFTKTKYANIQEVREFGERLYEIAKEKVPYIIDQIDNAQEKSVDVVDEYLNKVVGSRPGYKVLDKPVLINSSSDIDRSILISAIMRRYQVDERRAKKIYEEAMAENPKFAKELMRKIAFESDGLELTQVNFQFQVPLSFAVLTHLTRHRTHDILIPDFAPTVDLMQYKTPPAIKGENKEKLDQIFLNNKRMYDHFKNDYGVRDEDLVYFTLSGNMVNVVTNMDGKTVKHILGLRECTKAQWETREMAYGMHNEIDKLNDAQIFSSILGAACTTQGFCPEGKESCGRILELCYQENN